MSTRARIYKYPLPELRSFVGDGRDGGFELELPVRALIVSFGEDLENRLCIWAAILPSDSLRGRYRFALLVTGQDVPEDFTQWQYVGRATHVGLIWHLVRSSAVENSWRLVSREDHADAEPPRCGRLLRDLGNSAYTCKRLRGHDGACSEHAESTP